jgi:hypothetical protein
MLEVMQKRNWFGSCMSRKRRIIMRNHLVRILAIFTMVILALPSFGAAAQRLPVPAGTRLLIRLESTISSKTSRPGDRFTARVISPRTYKGAVVQGHIAHLKESGILEGKTELGLEFDTIRLPNQRTARLNAELEEIRQSESVKAVDEEGNIYSGSRGQQAIKRTAIGAAIGGILGGLIGGRKGVAIGLLVGGGAGAGSLVIDGRKELRLEAGTEMLIRTLKTSSRRDESNTRP